MAAATGVDDVLVGFQRVERLVPTGDVARDLFRATVQQLDERIGHVRQVAHQLHPVLRAEGVDVPEQVGLDEELAELLELRGESKGVVDQEFGVGGPTGVGRGPASPTLEAIGFSHQTRSGAPISAASIT
jgi:hypothetical protein